MAAIPTPTVLAIVSSDQLTNLARHDAHSMDGCIRE
jgi:hypothetical protein